MNLFHMAKDRAQQVRRKVDKRMAAVLVVLCSSCSMTAWHQIDAESETTDNAQVYCDILPVPALVSGQVRKINFLDNEKVEASTVLVEIDPVIYRARLAQADADLRATKMELTSADAQVQLTRANTHGNSSLAQAEVNVSKADVDTTSTDIEQAKTEIDTQRITLAQAEEHEKRQRELYRSGFISIAAYDAERAQLDTQRAKLSEAEAKLASRLSKRMASLAQLVERKRRATISTEVTQPQMARAEAEQKIAAARVVSAVAAREIAARNLAYTRILAQQAGIVSNRRVTVGQMIDAGQPVANLVTCNKTAWVDANFKETQVGRMYKGQRASIEVDAYPGVRFDGAIEGLSAATGAKFSLLPPENATGNFTKVVQRIPVRIRLLNPPPNRPLMAGMSVVVTVAD